MGSNDPWCSRQASSSDQSSTVLLLSYSHAFLKKRRGYCNRLPPSVRPSVMLSHPKPLDKIQPNLVCELLA